MGWKSNKQWMYVYAQLIRSAVQQKLKRCKATVQLKKKKSRSFPANTLTLCRGASLVAHTVKRLPAMWETQVRPLGREDPLEKEMTTHSSTLAWTIPWMEEPGRLQSNGVPKSQTWLSDFTFHFHTVYHF